MVFTAFLGVAGLPVIWAFEPKVLALPWLATVVMTVSGILYMGAMLFYLRAIQSEEASVVAPLFQANTLFTFALGADLLHELPQLAAIDRRGLVVGGAIGLSLDKKLRLAQLQAAAGAADAAAPPSCWRCPAWCSNSSPCMTSSGPPPSGPLSAKACSAPPSWRVPRYRKQFLTLFRRNPGAVIGVNAANELINLGGGLGVRYASLLAPVGLVSAISATSTFFVFLFGILLTLFFPRIGREDLSARNVYPERRWAGL